MRVLLLLVLLFLFTFNSRAQLPEVRLNENAQFVDSQGRVLMFHGINSVYKKPPYYDVNDVSEKRLDLFRKWGFNVVRLGVLWHPTYPEEPGRLNETYLKAIEMQVDKFAKAGIYVILDMHQDSLSSMYGSYDAIPLWLLKRFSRPPWIFRYPWPRKSPASGDWEGYITYACQKAFQDIYDNEKLAWNYWGDFWEEVAKRFKNKTNVLGYELINEPFAGNIYTNPLRAMPAYAGKHNLAPVYDYLVSRIRSVDKQKFIFFEGVTWSVYDALKPMGLLGPGFARVPGAKDDPEEYRRSVFSYHYYCPLIELANTSQPYSYFRRTVCDKVIMPKMFASVESVSRRLKSGLFLTEFGICVPDGDPNSINTLECQAVMDAADTQLQSWAYWDAPQFFDQEGNPRNITVKSFARVYPISTVGTPIDLVFNVNNGSGSYSFASTNLTLEFVKKGESIASIFLPIEMHYPRGYKIEVTPKSISYNVTKENDHLIELFGPSHGITEGTVIMANIHAL
nr:glycoside hydrolase subgroup catalytic core [Hymenolepis microstoma]